MALATLQCHNGIELHLSVMIKLNMTQAFLPCMISHFLISNFLRIQNENNLFAGVYHYHQTPDCLYDNTNDEFIGVALDGFPIYGIKNSTGQEMTSKDLDQCHGHVYNGEYRYRLTRDYPYIMGCFKGTRANQGGRTPPEDCTKGSKASGIHAFPFQTSFLLPIVIGMVIQMVSK